jgi:predicted ATPase
MLTSLRIQNFKSWRDTTAVRLAPLTVIFGANSAGKSSLGHLLLALKQTAQSTDRKRALNLGDANTLVDLGTFEDCIHNHNLKNKLTFSLDWTLPRNISVSDSLDAKRQYIGDTLHIESHLRANLRTRQPETVKLKYRLSQQKRAVVETILEQEAPGKFSLESPSFKLTRSTGRKWPIEAPEKFYRVSETTIAKFQNAAYLTDFALAVENMFQSITYLGPLREPPKRIYQWSGDSPESVGMKGEFAIAAILAAQSEGRELNRRPKTHKLAFAEFIAAWLKDLELINSFEVKAVAEGRKEYEVHVRVHEDAPLVKITDVGFGVSQVLPVLVQAFYGPPNSTVWMEQPEIHLHPNIQSNLADVFISAIKANENGKPRNSQLIIETHSEHFLTRLQRRIAEDQIKAADVVIYFVRRGTTGEAKIEELRVNDDGEIENWPDNFFGDPMVDLTARVDAMVSRAAG